MKLDQSRKTLAIIGAGPKGIAVAIKAKVMEEMGLPVDRVVLIEQHSVAAHWSGEAGYTDGEMRLGTSPEKDVVFPMKSLFKDEAFNRAFQSRLMQFSWTFYLIQKGDYSDWVDRGKPAPKHSEWAQYLKWVSEQISPEVSLIPSQVESLDLETSSCQWKLNLKNSTGNSTLYADRLMLTGPGKTRLSSQRAHAPDRIYDLESFWKALKEGRFKATGRIGIVGAGENAASVLLTLSKLKSLTKIEVISPKGFVSTRAENFYENQFYSNPKDKGWKDIEVHDRVDFIRRTDIGVFSVDAMKALNGEVSHSIIPGRLISIKVEDQGLLVDLDYAGQKIPKIYDQIILATGFDPLSSLKSILTPIAYKEIESMLGGPLQNETLTHRIQEDLSVEGLHPRLHLPMLAGVRQGPGFANLSCLGLLSDRVLMETNS